MPAVNRDLGPCVIIWDEQDVNRTYSKTFGGVNFRYEEIRVPIKEDQHGETDVDEVTTGAINPELDVPMTREELAQLDAMFARSELGTNNLRVKNPVGVAVFPLARQVIVKPISNNVVSTNQNEWLYIHRAFPRITMEYIYDNANQRNVKVIFKGFPDDISGRQDEFFRHGPK